MSDQQSQELPQASFWTQLKKYLLIPVDSALLSIAPEIGHLSPLILIVGTGLLSLLTLNTSLAVFAGSSVEALFLFTAVQSLTGLFSTPTAGVEATKTSPSSSCKSYFETLTPTRFQWLMGKGIQSGVLNQPLYFISFAFMYALQSMFFFDKETTELGPQYSNRPYLTVVAGLMFISLYLIYLMVYGCDSIQKLFFTVIIGIVFGFLIAHQNNLLFGKGAVNLLFIPPLERRTGMDFLCVKT